jgi:glycosyltransferase involved in cell wall biosynthesis
MVIQAALVAVCTHNPNPAKLHKVLTAIKGNAGSHRIVVIDNASTNTLDWDFQFEFDYLLIHESRLGNAYARLCALQEARNNELVIFVDDDNYIDENYIETALEIARIHPDWECFGGRQSPSPLLPINKLNAPFLPYLGIRDMGELELCASASFQWNRLEPIGAGMCIRPRVVESFLRNVENQSSYFSLGRKGERLLSGEDSFIARETAKVKGKWGYSPDLKLVHDIRESRLKYRYLAKLLINYGISDVLLELALLNKISSNYPATALKALGAYFYTLQRHQGGWILGLRHIGQFLEIRSYSKKNRENHGN